MNAATTAGVNPWLAHRAKVVDVVKEYYGVNTYHLRIEAPDRGARYECQPGQFNMLYIPGVGEAAISVSGRDASRGAWLHTVRSAGAVTGTLERLGAGADLAVRGPFGRGWPLEAALGHDLIFVAGGIGLAPLRPAIESALEQRGDFGALLLIHGARTPATLLYERQYADWQHRGLRVQTIVDRAEQGWIGNVGVVTQLIDRLRPMTLERTAMYACGPEVMMRFTAQSALERGLAAERIWLSMERNMQCAAGFCGHCQLGPTFICKDGPVMRHDRIAPYLDVEAL